jgi:hypothetical protein
MLSFVGPNAVAEGVSRREAKSPRAAMTAVITPTVRTAPSLGEAVTM